MIWAVSLAVVAALLVVARVVIRSRAKDAPGNQTVAVAFAPPREVTPATAAAILREVDNRLGIPAEILDLAREGVWQLGARDANRDGTKKVWFVTRRTQREPKLRPVPQEVYRTLFPAGYAGDEATLDGSTSIAQGFAGAVGEAEREVVKRGWVTTSQSPWTISLDLLGGLVAALAILPIAFGWFDLTWLPLQLVAGVAALVSRWIRPRRWQLTDKGRRLTDELAGLKQYMTLAEAERLRLLAAPETIMKRRVPNGAGEIAQVNERLLPYAVLFGILPQWAQVVQRSYADAGVAPGWLLLPGDPSGALSWLAFTEAGGLDALDQVGSFDHAADAGGDGVFDFGRSDASAGGWFTDSSGGGFLGFGGGDSGGFDGGFGGGFDGGGGGGGD